MILRFLATLALIWNLGFAAVEVSAQGLNAFTDAQIQQYIQTDRNLAQQKQQQVYQYQAAQDQIAANRAQQELDVINARLRDYSRELDRRRAIANNTATGSTNSGSSYTSSGNGAYGPGTTTTETVNTVKSNETRTTQPGTRQVWIPPENRGGIEAGHREYSNTQFSAGPGGVTSGHSRSSVTTHEDGSTESEHSFYKVGIQKTQNFVQFGTGNNMPAPANSSTGQGFNYADTGPKGLGLAPDNTPKSETKELEDERDTKDGPEEATIEGDETPGFKDPGKCDGGTIFCGIGLKEGANYTGKELDDKEVGITTNVNMKKLVIGWIKFFLGIIAVIAVIALIYAGILMIVHMGDDSQIEKAKKIIIWAVVGIILVFLAFAIVNTLTILGDPENSSSSALPIQEQPLYQTDIT